MRISTGVATPCTVVDLSVTLLSKGVPQIDAETKKLHTVNAAQNAPIHTVSKGKCSLYRECTHALHSAATVFPCFRRGDVPANMLVVDQSEITSVQLYCKARSRR